MVKRPAHNRRSVGSIPTPANSEYPKVIRTLTGGVFGTTREKLSKVDSLKEEIHVRKLDAESLAEAAKIEAEMWREVHASIESDDPDEDESPTP